MLEEIKNSKIDKIKHQVVCPVELALRILGGKWRGSILYQLRRGPLRFNELKYHVQDAVVDYDDADNFLSNKVLTEHLTDLMEFGLVRKETPNGHSHYQLTARGLSVIPILLDLFEWGETNYQH
ncbi:MAG: transcriptional regulator [Crocinitomicaceae bacterium]|nr:transcriptional regulator [Crocinitomicaceae bacterium]|tara:strand:+ start:58978 stop:59349 length:372 start_codon:yes stop_codon:yes gene_type:complete